MAIYALGEASPRIHPEAYVHPDAVVIGNVIIGANSSVWPSAVIRGDEGVIVIGESTSIQDGSVLHTTECDPTIIGDRCTIGHLVHIEGAVVKDGSLIGSGSTVLPGAIIGKGVLVGAHALVTPGTVIPDETMALGAPAKVVEKKPPQIVLDESVNSYVQRAARFREGLKELFYVPGEGFEGSFDAQALRSIENAKANKHLD